MNGFILPLLAYSNCHTKECIYIIHCKLCKNNTYYIGETSNARARIHRHLSDIKTCIPFYKYTCVSTHFNLIIHNYHNISEIFEFFIFDVNDLDTKIKRLNKENQLINLFLALNMNVINDDIPNKYSITF